MMQSKDEICDRYRYKANETNTVGSGITCPRPLKKKTTTTQGQQSFFTIWTKDQSSHGIPLYLFRFILKSQIYLFLFLWKAKVQRAKRKR